MYYLSLNTPFVSWRGESTHIKTNPNSGKTIWSFISMPFHFQNNSYDFFCLEYSGIDYPYVFLALFFLHIWSLFLPWVISQIINFSTVQVKRHNKIGYFSSVHGEKNRKGLNCCSKCQYQLTPLASTSFSTAPGYEKPLTCCSISALLTERANSAEPGCMSGNKRTRIMPVRLPIVPLFQCKKALGIAHLLSTPSKSISSKEYSAAFFSWLIVCLPWRI